MEIEGRLQVKDCTGRHWLPDWKLIIGPRQLVGLHASQIIRLNVKTKPQRLLNPHFIRISFIYFVNAHTETDIINNSDTKCARNKSMVIMALITESKFEVLFLIFVIRKLSYWIEFRY